MNLIQGRLMDNNAMPDVLQHLPQDIAATLQKPLLDTALVVDACDKLVASVSPEEVLPILESLGMDTGEAQTQYNSLKQMFGKEYLTQRIQTELGEWAGEATGRSRNPLGLGAAVQEALYPLGVLLHIAAGNMDGLPVYSVIEGLLTGNINLLKLPSVDGGLSVLLLQKLFAIEPQLAEYVYVFELSSTEIESISQLAQLADGIVVWGGDEAVQSVRRMAPPNTRIIEWGHKLSFAYVTKQGTTKAKLEGLAHNICATNGLLCSSCQGVYMDTDSEAEQLDFCESFLPILEQVATQYPEVPLSARAQNTLQLYSRGLENVYGNAAHIFKGKGVSLVAEGDNTLSPSLQFRSLWVKRLPREGLIATLHPHKTHLQTAALLCGPSQWKPLHAALWRAGVVRVCNGADMSETYCGAAHDGEYPLRRYTRVVSAQK